MRRLGQLVDHQHVELGLALGEWEHDAASVWHWRSDSVADGIHGLAGMPARDTSDSVQLAS